MPRVQQTASIEPCHIAGIPASRMQNATLCLIVIPKLGGKIVSLRSGENAQTEWLWKNPTLPYQTAALDDSYTERHDTGGIDECFPSVDACQLPNNAAVFAGQELPDHGELYGRPWRVERQAIDGNGCAILSLSRRCSTLPCVFHRTLKVHPGNGGVELQYQLKNLGPEALPFSWCLHPAFAIAPGMKLHLPENHRLRCSYASTQAPLQTGDTLVWPYTASDWDLSRIPARSSETDFAAKLLSATNLQEVARKGEPVMVGLERPANKKKGGEKKGREEQGELLFFEWQPEQTPHIALWLNYGGWAPEGKAPYFNLVLEPAIGNVDSLAELFEAAEKNSQTPLSQTQIPQVAPGETRRWSLTLRVESTLPV